jgi:acyl dehydratase
MVAKTEYNRGLRYEQFNVGDEFVTASRTINECDIWQFACWSGDWSPIHTDEEFCKTQQFGTRIAHGLLTVAIGTGLANQLLAFEGTSMALLETTSRLTGVVKPGDTIRVIIKVVDKKETKKYPDRGIITYDCRIYNQRDEKVVEMRWVLMIRKEGY